MPTLCQLESIDEHVSPRIAPMSAKHRDEPIKRPAPTRTVPKLIPSSDGGDGTINILIVDDEPKNLTVLETVLDRPALPAGPGRIRRHRRCWRCSPRNSPSSFSTSRCPA